MSETESAQPVDATARRSLWGTTRFIVERVLALDLGGISSTMTLATLTGLVPLLALSLAVFAAFPAFSSLRSELDQLILDSFLPETYAGILSGYIRDFSRHAAGLTTFGLVGLGITAMLLINKLFATINRIFRVKTRRHFAHRLLIYWALLTVGPFALASSIALTGQVAARALSGIDSGAAVHLYQFGQLALQSLTFALIYKWIPNRPVRFLHAWMGGLVVSVLFVLVKDIFAVYVANGSLTNIYGAFVALPVLVLWVHIGWYLLFAGATITALIPEIAQCRRIPRPEATGAAFDAAVGILDALVTRNPSSGPALVTLEALRSGNASVDTAWDAGLQALVDTGYIRITGDESRTEAALVVQTDRATLEPLVRHLLVDLDQPHLRRTGITRHLLASEGIRTPIRTLFGQTDTP